MEGLCGCPAGHLNQGSYFIIGLELGRQFFGPHRQGAAFPGIGLTVSDPTFPGKLALQQRVLPAYRGPFFDALASACDGGLSVFAGQPLPVENIAVRTSLEKARYTPAVNRNFFPIRSPLYQCWQGGLLEWLARWQPDALIIEANPRVISNRRAIRWMHARGRVVLGWGLGIEPERGGASGLFATWRRRQRLGLMESLDGVIAYSRRGAQQYRAAGFPPGRVFVAPNAVTPRPEKAPPSRPDTFQGHPVVLFVGRLQERKRIDNLLHACANLPTGLQPDLWVVGDGPARKSFEDLAQAIYPSAHFPGALRGPDLEPYFQRADLFVLPGTGGLAVQQAMAHGLPVIVAQGDGTQEDLVRLDEASGRLGERNSWKIQQGENGWLVQPNDRAALNQALVAALSDAAQLRWMGDKSYQIVSQEINLEEMVRSFIQALRTLTSKNSRQVKT